METTATERSVASEAVSKVIKPGQSGEQVTELYNQWSNYDEHMEAWAYAGPHRAAEGLIRYLSDNKDAYILDVAAGTGRIADEIKKAGFTNIDALDPSKGMLQIARSKNLYKNYFEEFFNENVECIETSKYDALVASGALIGGHLKMSCFPEMIRCVKPGGLVFLTIAETSFVNVEEYKDKLEPYMENLQTQGLWQQVERLFIPDFHSECGGFLLVYKITKTA